MPESLAVRRAGISTALTRVNEVLESFASRDHTGEILTAIRHFPAREAQWADFPTWVNADLAAAYAAKGIRRLYTLHNVFYAGSAYLSGWLSDHVPSRKSVLAAGYALAGVTAILLCTGTHSLGLLAVIFVLAGLYIGTEEPLEDSLSAELVPKEQHGMAFGTLAAVNAVGDFVSSLLVGFLWSAFNVQTAFTASAILFFAGAVLILRLRGPKAS